ncbi:MAG: 6-bladed beta-propeller [Candidatus Aquicultor sp.]
MLIFVAIVLVGTSGILYYSLSNYNADDSGNDQKAPSYRPQYISAVTGDDHKRLKGPMGIAAANGALYVADSDNGRLAIVSATGTLKKVIDVSTQAGDARPVGVAVDRDMRIYVSTLGTEGAIFVYDRDGKFLYRFPEGASDEGSVSALPGRPIALCTANERLYVTDVLDQDVKVYDLKGRLITRFGRPGSDKGQFLYPNGITADRRGTIYVSDSNNARVQVFSSQGEFLNVITGSEKEAMALPRGIALDRDGRLHVVDMLKHKVFVFAKDGRFIGTYGGFGTTGKGLAYPNGIAIDTRNNEILIADKLNNRIAVWK